MRIQAFLAFTITLFVVLPSMGQTIPPVFDFQDSLDQTISLNQGNGGGVFRVQSNTHDIWWEGASGNFIQNGPSMPTDATFEIASITKTITAAAALLLVEDGLIGLDQPIGELLPPMYTTGLLVINNHDYTPELTVRQLLAHTSGLPDYWNDPPWAGGNGINAFLLDYINNPNRFYTPQEILSYVPALTPISIPGTSWHYSDTGYVLIGLMIEEVTGQELHTFYRKRIFAPLSCNDTWLHWRETPASLRTQSHRYEWSWDMYDNMHNSADWAGGGLVSSTRDLELFIRALADNTLFSNPNTINEMMNWVPTGAWGVQYGLGLFRVELGDGEGYIWGHDGYCNSWMYYWPRYDVVFTGALNQYANDWWPLVKSAIAQIDSAVIAQDINGDGVVNVSDLLLLISTWGPCAGCTEDLNGDGTVNISDLLELIGAWGP